MISEQYTGNNIVFIVGCPRSGTTWLQQLLASYPKAKTGRETHLFSWLIGPQLRAWRKEMDRLASREDRIGVGPPAYFTEDKFLRNLKQYLLVLLQPMVGNLKQDEFFIEKTPNHALFIPEIVQMLPDSKIIHVLRDARDTVASLMAVNKSSRGKGGGNVPWAPESAREAGTATGIPVAGEFQRISGITLSGTRTFARKANVGSWKGDLTLKQKLGVWLVARKTMNEVGYQWKYPWQ